MQKSLFRYSVFLFCALFIKQPKNPLEPLLNAGCFLKMGASPLNLESVCPKEKK